MDRIFWGEVELAPPKLPLSKRERAGERENVLII